MKMGNRVIWDMSEGTFPGLTFNLYIPPSHSNRVKKVDFSMGGTLNICLVIITDLPDIKSLGI